MAMFSGNFPESHQPEIKFEEMDAQCLRMAIEFIYTSQLDLTDECVQQVLQTATFLQLEHLADLCAEYMTNLLDAENCLGFKQFAEKQNNYLLLECAKDYIIGHFLEVLQCEEFFEMTYEEVKNSFHIYANKNLKYCWILVSGNLKFRSIVYAF